LLVALASHAVMRIWSGFDFIPKVLAFERAEPGTASEAAALAWTRRSQLRLPLDLVTCAAMLCALAAARLGLEPNAKPFRSLTDFRRIPVKPRVDGYDPGPYFPPAFGIPPGPAGAFC
jgi:hypothetical protein